MTVVVIVILIAALAAMLASRTSPVARLGRETRGSLALGFGLIVAFGAILYLGILTLLLL